MAKKVWISLPLMTATADLKAESVIAFLKGGQKKELEIETAAFITKWLVDKDVPFSIDFETLSLDRNLVMAALPKRLQKALGHPPSVATDAGEVPQVGEVAPVGDAVTGDQPAEVATETEEPNAGTGPADDPSGPR